jgi:hypothetical protein
VPLSFYLFCLFQLLYIITSVVRNPVRSKSFDQTRIRIWNKNFSYPESSTFNYEFDLHYALVHNTVLHVQHYNFNSRLAAHSIRFE